MPPRSACARRLLQGTLPSGYPPEIEVHIESLLNLHREPESEAQRHLPPFVAKIGKPTKRKRPNTVRILSAQRLADQLDVVPEVDLVQLLVANAGKASPGQMRAAQYWSFPKGYLLEVRDCAPADAIIVAAPTDMPLVARSDRLIVDTSVRNPVWGEVYLALDRRDEALILFKLQDPNATFPAETETRLHVIGRICGKIGDLTLKPR